MTTDSRMQVVLGLMPADAVFLREGTTFWRPGSGYVSSDNPWQAGLYAPHSPRNADVVPAKEYLGERIAQDDTPLAVLIDEIIRLRALIDNLVPEDKWLSAEADASEAQELCDELAAALIERGHTDECYSGDVDGCDCPLRVLSKLPKEQV